MLPEKSTRPSVFVPKVILAGGEVGRYGPTPQSAVGYEFYNGTSEDVTVVLRTGVQIEIPPLRGARYSYFAIVTKYRLGFNVNVDTRGLLNDQGHATSLEAEKIESAVFRDDRRPGQSLESEIEYRISRQDFHENGGSLYLPNLDLVVSVINPHYAPKHPYSKIGLRQAMMENDSLLSNGEGLSYQIRIIDRHGRFGDRFVNIDGKVYRIRATSDSDALCGVYVCSPVPTAGSHDMLLPQSTFFTFEEVDKHLRLYTTYQDAKTLGNPELVFKRELDERAHQIKMDKQKWDEESHQRNVAWETQKREWERERETAKQEQARRDEDLKRREHDMSRMEHEYSLREAQIKRETQILKEISSTRDHNRKEMLEVLKYIPALITGAGAIYMAVKKMKSGSS